jgi:hypothetical protein
MSMALTWRGPAEWRTLRKIAPATVTIDTATPRLGDHFILRCAQTALTPIFVHNHTLSLIFREASAHVLDGNEDRYPVDPVVDTISFGAEHLREGESMDREWIVQIPQDATPTFEGKRNALRWVIQITVALSECPAYEDEFEFRITPIPAS